MKISIVMTTYNGSSYILAQLQSLYRQERPADEVIILDDGSTDNTASLVEQFIQANNLNNWKLKVNQQNIGWKQNFKNGFQYAKGDLIFPCDQDDVWYTDKLKVMAELMENHPEILLLVGKINFLFMDAPTESNSKLNRYKISQFLDMKNKHTIHNTKVLEKKIFNKKYKTVAQGCRMCFRRKFWDEINEFWTPNYAHDSFLSFYAQLMGGYYLLDYVVMDYRYHIGSASTPIKRNRATRLKELEIDAMEISNINKHFSQTSAGENEWQILMKARKWNSMRLRLIEDKNYWCGIQLLGLLPYYTKFRRYLTDWLYAIRGR